MAYLHLCKMDPDVRGPAKFIGVVGSIVEVDGGYQFSPNTSGHARSRKTWSSALDCIPAWTDRLGFLQLLTPGELSRHTRPVGEQR